MRKELGVLVVEQANGTVGFQASESVTDLKCSFDNMNGRVGEERRRATCLSLSWDDGNLSVESATKILPVMPKLPTWGHRLGVGELEEPEEMEDGKSN